MSERMHLDGRHDGTWVVSDEDAETCSCSCCWSAALWKCRVGETSRSLWTGDVWLLQHIVLLYGYVSTKLFAIEHNLFTALVANCTCKTDHCFLLHLVSFCAFQMYHRVMIVSVSCLGVILGGSKVVSCIYMPCGPSGSKSARVGCELENHTTLAKVHVKNIWLSILTRPHILQCLSIWVE